MFPYIEVKGTHREIGRAIGESLRKEVGKALKIHFNRYEGRRKKIDQKKLRTLTRSAEKFFPDFIEELKGISEGANQAYEKLLFFSFEEELSPGEKCSTMAVKNSDTIFFAHNEDWDLELPIYIIKAKPKNKPGFLSVANAGQFPGTVVGMNDAGIVYSGNSIGTSINFGGMPKTYCLRKFLECRSLKDVVGSLERNYRTSGNNSVIVSGREKKIVTIEWSPKNIFIEEMESGISHTNHYLSSDLKKYQNHPTSRGSLARHLHLQETILKMKDPKIEDIKKIMRTHINHKYSICQHGKYRTLTSVIVDTAGKKMLVSEGTPCRHTYQTFVLK